MPTCCCCIELRIGGIIIAILQVIEAIGGIFYSYSLKEIKDLKGYVDAKDINYILDVIKVIAYITMGFFAIQLFVALFLIYGILNRKPSFITGWINFRWLIIIIGIILEIAYLIYVGFKPELLVLILCLLLEVYFTCVIVQLKRKMKAKVCAKSGNVQVTLASKV